MIRYRIHIETPWAGCEWTADLEFDEEPDEATLEDCLAVEYANNFPAGWWKLEDGEE